MTVAQMMVVEVEGQIAFFCQKINENFHFMLKSSRSDNGLANKFVKWV